MSGKRYTKVSISADEIQSGDTILPPGRKLPVKIETKMDVSPDSPNLEFAASNRNGYVALVLPRYAVVDLFVEEVD